MTLFGDDLDEQQHRFGQRFLPTGEHLRVADRRLQRQYYVRKGELADAVGHRTPVAV
jgi:hypothetical protein